MNLALPTKGLDSYKSASQRARVGTESWGAANFFCPACESPSLDVAPRNTVAVDYFCPSCKSPFQLKAVRTVLLVPHFAFALSAVERRKPLASTARRAGWVGCNILLEKIPVHARIPIVSEGSPHTPREVRGSYDRLRPLEKLQGEKRGWTLDVLQVLQSLGKLEFTLADVYAHADSLAKLHPNNAHVRDKIRQQLQVLRDLDLLKFLGDGSYRLT
jgi:type II restriction enzyme